MITKILTRKAGWLRIFGYGIRYTKNRPLFSERNAYRKPFLCVGYRLFFIKPLKRKV